MADDKDIKRLRKLLEEELRKDKLEAALKTYAELERLEPKLSRHPHKRGDLLRRMGRIQDAVGAYDRAVDCYVEEGFVARAVAMAKTVLVLDPSRMDVLERVDPSAARAMKGAANRPATAHSAILPEDDAPSMGHSAILPEDDGPITGHSAILPEDDLPPPRAHAAVIPESAPPLARPQLGDTAGTRPNVVDSMPPLVRPVVDETPPSEPPAPPPVPLPRPPRRPKFSSTTMQAVRFDVIEEAPVESAAAPKRPGPPPLPKPRTSIRPAAPLPPQRKPTPFDDAGILSTAPELVRAPDAGPNEVRFSDLPPRPPLAAPVTIVEMKTRQTLPPIPGPPVRTATPGDLALMPLFPLFSELPREAFLELVQAASLVEMTHGKYVVRRGDPADCLYGIVEGSVQIQPPGLPPELYVPLSEGDVFGESCLLRDEPRHADVVVQGHLTALRMPKAALDGLVRKHRAVAEVLLDLLTRRLLGNLLNGSQLFADIDPVMRTELASMFEIRRAPINTALMEGGKRSDGLYIALTGRVLCKLPGVADPVEAGAGSMFGHTSLLGEAPSEVGVRTLANMIVLRLPAQRFARLAMQHAGLLARITDLPPLADISL